MSPNWRGIWTYHGIRGNVYKYKIPIAAIKAAGGIKRYDSGSEVVFTREVWEDYDLGHTEFHKLLGKKDAEREMNQVEKRYFKSIPLGQEKIQDIIESMEKSYRRRYFKTKEDESNPYNVKWYNDAIKELKDYLNSYPYR